MWHWPIQSKPNHEKHLPQPNPPNDDRLCISDVTILVKVPAAYPKKPEMLMVARRKKKLEVSKVQVSIIKMLSGNGQTVK